MTSLPLDTKSRVRPRGTTERLVRRGRVMERLVRRGCTLQAYRRSGFSLVEAMVAVSITAIAGAAILLGIQSSLQTTTHVLEKTIAQGLAHQLMDEITGCRYVEYGTDPYQAALVPGSDELATGTREIFDDIGDFNAQDNQSPVDAWGVMLGHDDGQGGTRNEYFTAPRKLLDRLRRTVEVYYVDPDDLSQRLLAGATSDYRAVEVSVFYVEDGGEQRELVKLRRIVVNIPQ